MSHKRALLLGIVIGFILAIITIILLAYTGALAVIEHSHPTPIGVS